MSNIQGVKNSYHINRRMLEIKDEYKRIETVQDNIKRIVDVFNNYVETIEYESVEYEWFDTRSLLQIKVKGFYFIKSKITQIKKIIGDYELHVLNRTTITIKL